MRRVHQHQRVAPPSKSDPRKELRVAQRELAEAEARVAELEDAVAERVAGERLLPGRAREGGLVDLGLRAFVQRRTC